jgi:hypothetical protein
MMGRSAGDDFTDEPTWREKWEERRSNPLWVPERPDWIFENVTTLALLFVGIAAVLFSAVYVVVPPGSLPSGMPGYFDVAKAEAEVRDVPTTASTTTTTTPAKKRAAFRADVATWDSEKQLVFWRWVAAVEGYRQTEADAARIVRTPRQPPTRAWPFALILGVGAAVLLAGAWRVSDTRSHREWGS